MDSDVPKKMSGFFKEFKAYRARTKRAENQSKHSKNHKTSIQVLKRTGDIAAFDAEKIAVAIGKAFLAVEGQNIADSSRIHDRIEQLTEMVLNTFNRSSPNYDLYCYASNAIKQVETVSSKFIDSLEDNIESCISSLFKKLKKINSTIAFITTRNFSIQKNLSISA